MPPLLVFCQPGDQLEVFEKTRDTDGTVDRVPDPPEALKKWLLLLKMKNTSAGIGLAEMLRLQGAKANGVMDRGTFLITLRTVYKEWSFQEQLLFSFAHTYGCGLVDGSGLKESVAWRDFCEDVELQVQLPSMARILPFMVRPHYAPGSSSGLSSLM